MIATNALLVRLVTVAGDAQRLLRAVKTMPDHLPRCIKAAVVSRQLAYAAGEARAYWYLRFAEPMLLNTDEIHKLQATINARHAEVVDCRASRLQKVFDAVAAPGDS